MVLFDYNTFYNYYTNQSNLNVDPNPPEYSYYDFKKSIKQNKNVSTKKRKSGNFIEINGIKIYIDVLSDQRLVFTIENPAQLDHHYHFGLKDIYKDNKLIKVVFFHKTTQNLDSNGNMKKNVQTNCYFEPNSDISNIIKIADLACKETKDSKMRNKFSEESQDFRFISEIISRPFRPPTKGGKRTNIYKTRKYKNKSRKTRKTRK